MVNSDPNFGPIIFFGLVALVAYGGWRHKNRPRFIVDEHGERQRVITWNRGQPVYDPKTWQQRVHEETIKKRERHFTLLWSVPALAAVLYVTFWVGKWWLLVPEAAAVPIILIIIFGWRAFKNLGLEFLYDFGYQGMQGAKVLDKRPGPAPGKEVVETQMAHGDARLAGEAEALSLLNPKN